MGVSDSVGSPARPPRRHSLVVPIIATVIVGLLVTTLLALATRSLIERQDRVQLNRAVTQMIGNIRSTADSYDEALYGMRGTIASNRSFDRAAFHRAVGASAMIERLSAMRAIQWAVPVAKGDAARFERRADAETIPGVPLPETVIHPPLSSPTSFVVEYVEPVEGNDQAFGLNLTGLPGRTEIIDAAVASGEIATSPPFSLVQQDGETPGFVKYLATYRGGDVPADPADRAQDTTGLVVGVFTGRDAFATAVPPDSTLQIAVYDTGSQSASPGAPAAAGLLYTSRPGLDPAQADDTVQVRNGERIWSVYVFETEDQQQWLLPALVALAGLLLTALFAYFVWVTGRARAEAEQRAVDLAASERRFQTLSMTDPLTGLANRRSLMHSMRTMAEVAHRHDEAMVVLFLDVDAFKSVNDTRGHRTGDELLRQIGHRLTESVRKSDIVGRMAGDEFCVAGLVSDEESAHRFAESVRVGLEEPFDLDGVATDASVSIGATVIRRPMADTIEHMIDEADNAMYDAKRQGDQRIVWHDAS